MKLFLITGSNDDGDNLDLLVWAENVPQAVELWEKYYEQSICADSKAFEVIDVGNLSNLWTPGPRAIPWDTLPCLPAKK